MDSFERQHVTRDVVDHVGDVEQLGVAPIPEERRNMKPSMVFTIWALASASATTPVIGLILYNLGFVDFAIAMVLTGIIAIIPAGLFGEQGRQIPIVSMVAARLTFGSAAAALLALVYTLVGAAWFGINTEVGGDILAQLFPGFGSMWYWVLGVGQTLLVFLGMKWLSWFYKYTAYIFIAAYAILTYYLFTRYTVHLPVSSGPVHWGAVVETILEFSILGWAYEFSSVSRFCAPATDDEPRRRKLAYFFAPTIGVLLPVLLMGEMGLLAQSASGNWNIALIAVHLPGIGVVAAIGVILAIAHTNAMNLYPAVTMLLSATATVRKPNRFDQPVAAWVLGLFATILAVMHILNYVENFLLVLGVFLIPFSFLMVFDWLYFSRATTPVQVFFNTDRKVMKLFRPASCIALIIGIALSSLDQLPSFPAALSNDIPWPFCASIAACGLYWLMVRKSPRNATLLSKPTSLGSPAGEF